MVILLVISARYRLPLPHRRRPPPAGPDQPTSPVPSAARVRRPPSGPAAQPTSSPSSPPGPPSSSCSPPSASPSFSRAPTRRTPSSPTPSPAASAPAQRQVSATQPILHDSEAGHCLRLPFHRTLHLIPHRSSLTIATHDPRDLPRRPAPVQLLHPRRRSLPRGHRRRPRRRHLPHPSPSSPAIGLNVKQILITHAHIDHIAGASTPQAAHRRTHPLQPERPPLLKMMDVQAGWLGVPTPTRPAPDDTLADGSSSRPHRLSRRKSSTPPATPRARVCLYFPAQDAPRRRHPLRRHRRPHRPARRQLPQLIDSIQTRLLAAPRRNHRHPGHGPATTIGAEREPNPFLQTC